MGGKRVWTAWWTPALALGLAGCYQSFFAGMEGDAPPPADSVGEAADRSDAAADGDDAASHVEDAGRADEGGTTDSGREDAVRDIPDTSISGHLEPESESESYFETDTGVEVEVYGGWLVPAAFSGSVYEILMNVDAPWDEDAEFTAVYRLAPGGDRLGTTFMDDAPDRSIGGTLCWTGEVFAISLPTPDVGIRILSVDEAGTLVRPAEVVGPDPAYTPSGSSFVACPSDGPFLVDRGRGAAGTDRIRPLRRDGSSEGSFVDVALPPIAGARRTIACTEAGPDEVCAADNGLVFISRDGTYRESDDLAVGDPCAYNGCDVAFTGDGVAVVWSEDSAGKLYLTYAWFDLDGNMVVPPTTAGAVGLGPLGIHAASSGDTVFVVAEGTGDRLPSTPVAYLLDRTGAVLGEPLDISASCVWSPPPCTDGPAHWRGMAVFWEGDAYSAIWNTWPHEIIAYRRWLVVP